MKNNIYNKLIISLLAILILVSCSKKTDPVAIVTPPQTCYLSSVSNAKGNILDKLTYDATNRLTGYANDSSGLAFDFAYTAQNLVDKITITDKNGTKIFVFVVTFTYDATGNATKAVTTVSGNVYQTNVFTYTGSQITKIVTTDAQAKPSVLTTRLEYVGDNVSKVYQKFDADKEYLYYEISKFDANKTNYPAAYKSLAFGLVGLFDSFTYLNKNNALSEKYYYDDGVDVYYSLDNTYEYNTALQPTKVTSAIDEEGVKSTSINTFQYTCK